MPAPCLDGPDGCRWTQWIWPAGSGRPTCSISSSFDRSLALSAHLGRLRTASASVWCDMRAHPMSGYIDWRAFNMTTM